MQQDPLEDPRVDEEDEEYLEAEQEIVNASAPFGFTVFASGVE